MKRVLARLTFWSCAGLLVHTHLTYPASLWILTRLRGRSDSAAGSALPASEDRLPSVSLIVAAHDEGAVIERKVANALALDYPRDRLELIVASDGSSDETVTLARAAGADRVLDLPRNGKIATQNAAVEEADGEVLAFSDANAYWRPDALRELVTTLERPDVGYVCGQVSFLAPEAEPGDGTRNEEGAYWRYEMAVRRLESGLGGVTAGNGAIYALWREAYVPLDSSRSHDLSFPAELRRRGWRSAYAEGAIAEEKLVPTLEGEFDRKRRMMRGLWDIVVADGMANPRGYGALFAFQIYSHRLIRYLSPVLHLKLLGASIVLAPAGWIYRAALALQLSILAAAVAGARSRSRLLALPRYYVLTTASIAAGLWDRLRHGRPAAWEKSEGTR